MRTETLHTQAAALNALLALNGLDATRDAILQAMEAPYLFLRRGGCYLAGPAFFTPEWLGHYLHPLGFHLTSHSLTRRDVRPFLQGHTPAVLLLPQDKALVAIRCQGQQVSLMQPSSTETLLTFPSLLKKLPESLTVLTLEASTPAPVDALPLLCESVHTLAAYRKELAALLPRTVTRQEMQPLHQQYFRPLMVHLPQIAHLYPDENLPPCLRELAHIYRHLFIIGEREILLREHLPLGMINRCTLWLQELILDRLDALGAPDEQLMPLYDETRLRP